MSSGLWSEIENDFFSEQENAQKNEKTIQNEDIETLEFGKEMEFEKVKKILKNRLRFSTNTGLDTDSLYLIITDEELFDGIILEKDTNKIICKNKQFIKKLDEENFKQLIRENNDSFKLEYCEDGTILRLYNYNGKWITATSRCTNAVNSYWSSIKSFDTMFWELFNYPLDKLDVNRTYIFILINKENRIVIKNDCNYLIYLNSIDNENNIQYEEEIKNEFMKVKSVENFNINEPLDNLYDEQKRGLILKIDNKMYQYDFQTYEKIKNIRGNTSSIRLRCIELLNDKETFDLFKKYYKEYEFSFNAVEHCMNNLYKHIYKLYVDSHIIHKVQINEDNKFYRTLKQLHAEYKNKKTRITLEHVIRKVNSLDTYIIKNLLGWK